MTHKESFKKEEKGSERKEIIKEIVNELEKEIKNLKKGGKGEKKASNDKYANSKLEKTSKRKIIGLIEEIILKGAKKEKKIKAKVDTGASRSSVGTSVLKEIGATPAIKKVLVTSAHYKEIRPLIKLKVKLNNSNDEWIESGFTVTSRKSMSYGVLIGKNTIQKMNVLIDPLKK